MGYALSPAVSFTFVDGRAIFLDLSIDRYFCLEPAQQNALKVLTAGDEIGSEADALLEPLMRRGILIKVAQPSTPAPCRLTDLPSRSVIEEGLPRPASWQVVAAALRIRTTKRALRRRPFESIIAQLRRRKARVSGQELDPHRIWKISAAFEATSLFLSPHRQCLPRSLALADQLARLGANVNLVMGVANNPFSAHCWVQHKDIVLNDRLEKVQGYTPVLVV